MAEVRYVGPSAAVNVRVESGGFVRVENGKTLKCSAALSKSLLRQSSSWERAGAKKASDGGDK